MGHVRGVVCLEWRRVWDGVRVKILILDDNQALRDAVGGILKALGHAVDTTDDAHAAVKMLVDGEYDFVLVDYKMPVTDGIWFMKNAQIPKRTKVLLMTAYVNKEVIAEMFDLGAVGYLIKPFDTEELVRHLEFHSDRHGAAAASPQ